MKITGSIKHKKQRIAVGAMMMSCILSLPIPAMAAAESETIPEAESETVSEAVAETVTGNGELWPQGPSIVGEAGIVMEATTGTVLYEKNIDKIYYPASITKVMTVLLAIENAEMNEIVTVPHEAVYMDDKGSHIALDEGEELTVEQCLYAVMLASANDAAYSLAIHVGGTIENFAKMMNEKAEELGCKNTNFVTPHGLPDAEHVTSAYDMALITQKALENEIFRKVSGTVYYEIPASVKQKDLICMYNHHKMMEKGRYYYEGITSGKTGYTSEALNTLVTCAQKGDMELICVTMKTEGKQVYKDTAVLLDYGFDNFKKINIAQNEEDFHEIPAGKNKPLKDRMLKTAIEEDSYVILPKSVKFSDLQKKLNYNETAGEQAEIAVLSYTFAGRSVGEAKLKWLGYGTEAPLFENVNSSQVVEPTIPQEQEEEKEKEKDLPQLWQVLVSIGVTGVFLVLYYAGSVLLDSKLMKKKDGRTRYR